MRDPGTCSTNLKGPRPIGFWIKLSLAPSSGGIDRGQRGEEVEAGIDLLGQLHLNGEVIDLLQPGDLLGLALFDRGRALDHADKPRAGIGLGAVHDAGVGPDDIVGRHLAAIVEIGVIAQLEGVNEASARDHILLGKLQDRLSFRGIPDVERTMQRLGVDLVLGALRGVNVQAGETRAIGRCHADGSALARRLGFRRSSERQSQARDDRHHPEHHVCPHQRRYSDQGFDHSLPVERKLRF
ncbi:hypothetical protein ABIA00_001026 [Bradyrhizobium ottawaense]